MADFGDLYKLYELIKNRNRKCFKFFKKNCLSEQHYERFRRAKPTSKYTQVKFLDEYIAIRTRYYSIDLKKYYHGLYIIGIDDSTRKFFCHRLPWRESFEDHFFMEKLNLDDVRFYMGITDGFERIQGDLLMRQEKISKNLLIQYITNIITLECEYKISDWLWDYKEEIEQYVKFKFALECDTLKCKLKSCKHLKQLYDKFLLLRQYRLRRCDTIYNLKEKLVEQVKFEIERALFKDEELLVMTLADLEKIYNIRAGNHIITLVGIQYMSDIYIVIREQEIEFKHREHGYVTVPIREVPALVEFRFLNAHRIHHR